MRVVAVLWKAIVYVIAMCAIGVVVDVVYWLLTGEFGLLGALAGILAGLIVALVSFFEE
jgi:hypothetical protein